MFRDAINEMDNGNALKCVLVFGLPVAPTEPHQHCQFWMRCFDEQEGGA